MSMTVRLSDDIVNKARLSARVEHRSVSKQIEYWVLLGKIAEENPDLPLSFIKDTLLAMQDTETSTFSLDT